MERSVEFGTRTAGEIMTPRVRTTTVEDNDRASAVIDLARQTGHSRFPVLDTDDNVVGTVHVKHAVALPVPERATTKIKHIMAKPIVVPDSLRLDPLLSILRGDGFQMADRPRRVRRPRRHRHPRGRDRGDRRRHRRRARPARRAGAPAPRRHLVAVRAPPARRGRGPDRHRAARPRGLRHDRRPGAARSLGRIPETGRRRRGAGARPLRPRRAPRAAGGPHRDPHGRPADRPGQPAAARGRRRTTTGSGGEDR